MNTDDILMYLKMINEKIDRLTLATTARSTGPMISVSESLEGPYDDPVIRHDPKHWKGKSCVGLKMSQCPPDFLDMHAGFLDWRVKKNQELNTSESLKYARYDAGDAARARGWANKLRTSGLAQVPAPAGFNVQDDELPF